MIVSKNDNNKNVLQINILQFKKKMRKIWITFDVKDWLLKSNFGTFWHLPNSQILPYSIIYIEKVDSLAKIFLKSCLKTAQPILPYIINTLSKRTLKFISKRTFDKLVLCTALFSIRPKFGLKGYLVSWWSFSGLFLNKKH